MIGYFKIKRRSFPEIFQHFTNSGQYEQEAHGLHRSPEKQFKSINTYDYIIRLIKRRKQTLLTL